MKKRIFYTGLLVLLTLSSFAINPVSPEKTHAQKIVDAIHNPKSNYVVVVSPGRLAGLSRELNSRHRIHYPYGSRCNGA